MNRSVKYGAIILLLGLIVASILTIFRESEADQQLARLLTTHYGEEVHVRVTKSGDAPALQLEIVAGSYFNKDDPCLAVKQIELARRVKRSYDAIDEVDAIIILLTDTASWGPFQPRGSKLISIPVQGLESITLDVPPECEGILEPGA